MKFLNPKTDTAFKRLFGNEHRKNLTISLLNSLLERKEGNLITEVTFRDNANLPETIDKKVSFVDINCVDQSGKYYIIEIQVMNEFNFLQRSQYYASYFLYRQLEVGKEYANLVPVIFIGMINHKLFDNDEVITHHLISNTKTGKQSLQHLEWHYIELPKFHKNINELTSESDKWLYFMKNAENLETIPQEFKNSKNLTEAFHVLEKALWTDAELEKYKVDEDRIGRERRQQEGARKEGRQATLELIAIKLLKKGLDIDLIVETTDLSVEEINELRKKIK